MILRLASELKRGDWVSVGTTCNAVAQIEHLQAYDDTILVTLVTPAGKHLPLKTPCGTISATRNLEHPLACKRHRTQPG